MPRPLKIGSSFIAKTQHLLLMKRNGDLVLLNNFLRYRGMKWGFTLEANRVPFSKNIFTKWAADVASLQGQEVLPTLPKMLLLHSKHKTNSILVSGTPLLTPCMYVLTTSLKDG